MQNNIQNPAFQCRENLIETGRESLHHRSVNIDVSKQNK